MPLRPRKCIGKKVKLTPINRSQNTPLTKRFLKLNPEKRGIQSVNPNKTPNTAPKDKT